MKEEAIHHDHVRRMKMNDNPCYLITTVRGIEVKRATFLPDINISRE
ncbi:hypothetical protein [Paenibacillus tengchongensis]|nr:hypothetical protein [Paenibacillus tengchongensis]